MKRRALFATGLLALAGCLATPVPDGPAPHAGARYALQGVMACPVAISGVVASSTKNAFFPASHVIDGNLSTAWAPGAATSTLTFALGTPVTLTALTIKASHQTPAAPPVTLDVAVSTNGGATYTTIATGLAPTPATLASLALPAHLADHVRLTFHTLNLYVCEVRFTGCPVRPSPTPTPTVKPTATPTANPTATPTATPTPIPDCCDTTGGGFVLGDPAGTDDENNKITFGYVAHHIGPTNSVIQGNIEVVDHRANGPTFNGDVTAISCVGNVVTFSGPLTGGGTFSCTVTDNGEPGDTDLFSFSTSTGYTISGELGGPFPGGGNIQVRDCSPQNN